jgi:hypothetical protein
MSERLMPEQLALLNQFLAESSRVYRAEIRDLRADLARVRAEQQRQRELARLIADLEARRGGPLPVPYLAVTVEEHAAILVALAELAHVTAELAEARQG